MRRYGETIKKKIRYKTRISIYGVIYVGKKILLTDQDEEEIQLPGGGVDLDEPKLHALIREVLEETGWKIKPIRHIGMYQRFVFMPEYELWAHKICHFYFCRGIYPLSEPLEKGHTPLLATPDLAVKLLQNQGDKEFLKQSINMKFK